MARSTSASVSASAGSRRSNEVAMCRLGYMPLIIEATAGMVQDDVE